MCPIPIKRVTFGTAVTFYFTAEAQPRVDQTLEKLTKLFTKLKYEYLIGYIFNTEHRTEIKRYIDSHSN